MPGGSEFDVTFPDGGEILLPGLIATVAWTGGRPGQEVKIEYSADNGSSYQTIVERTPNTGSYDWTVPQDISPACLIRISDADGALALPRLVSYDFSFKVAEPEIPSALTSLLTISAGVPDVKTQTTWSADISFIPDGPQGKARIFLNYGMADCQGDRLFNGTWHRVRIRFDLDSYLGSVWLDNQLMFEDAPLDVEPVACSLPELTISSASDWPAKVWVEDLEVRFQDHGPKLESVVELTPKPIVKEDFEKFEIGIFPLSGGWRIEREVRDGVRERMDRAEALKDKEGRSVQVSPDIQRQRGKAYIVRRNSAPALSHSSSRTRAGLRFRW
jgi:hypothetical protein